MPQSVFSTLKKTEPSYHSTVGKHTVSTWSTYSLHRIDWPNESITYHFHRTDYVNGQAQWSGASYGTTDTQRIASNFGIDLAELKP